MENPIIIRFLRAIFWAWLCANWCERVLKEQLVPVKVYNKMTHILSLNWHNFTHPYKHIVSELDIEAGWLCLSEEQYPPSLMEAALKKYQRKLLRDTRTEAA